MTQEEKQLLLKDICARLPYGVMIKDTYSGHYGRLVEIGKTFAYFISELNCNTLDVQLCHVKPYLRPMESMTEEEEKEINKFLGYRKEINGFGDICCAGWNGDVFVGIDKIYGYLNWLNAHHFDYQGLIEKGLALEAPEDMYKTE